jgi:hypothetical protein
MNDDRQGRGQPAEKAAQDTRQERLKLALRENLKRRKSQARARDDFMPASSASGEVAGGDKEGPGK